MFTIEFPLMGKKLFRHTHGKPSNVITFRFELKIPFIQTKNIYIFIMNVLTL